MDIVFQSVVMGCLVILATSSIVFPILFLVQRGKYNKAKLAILANNNK
ncbi:hypothetical protein [Anaerorhabdus furcosa]|uniref:Uncharacterized protein n=1 Tax=Anaerorhabdus furcosa TaxID=118967 RepID=A0A1T4L9N2_9FIRM|nr:hypothetical protein [Anaerorhabdus furcosa]SJZ51310.1 hypothetical protein SAMN02745191_0798 [Anaerorhabdus furcosa]